MQAQEFSLQPALSHKQRLEEVCQMELADLEMAYMREYQTLDLLIDLERRGCEDLHQRHQRGRLDLGLIDVCFYDLQTLQRRIAQQAMVLQELTDKVQRKRDELIEISKDKKALEKLKEKHEKVIAESLAKAENKIMQDIATSQFHRRVVAGGQAVP